MLKLKLPAPITVALSAIAGALVTLNVTTFHLGQPWVTGITVAITALAAFGISPLTGPALIAALHLPQKIVNIIAAGLMATQLALQTVTMSTTAHAIVAGVITLLAGLGFAPSVDPALE